MSVLGYTCLDVNEKAVDIPLRIFLRDQMGIQKLTGIGTPLQKCKRIALVVHFGVGSTPDGQQFMEIRGFSCVFPKF